MIPIVLSVFLALLVAPIDQWGMRHAPRRVRWLGHVAAMGAILTAIIVFVGALWLAAEQIAGRVPLDSESVEDLLPLAGPADAGPDGAEGNADSSVESGSGGTTDDGGGLLQRAGSLFGSAGSSLVTRIVEKTAGYASAVLTTAGTVLGGAALVFFLTLLMLVEAPRWREKLRLIGDRNGESEALRATHAIAGGIRRYLWARTLLGLLTGVLYALWLWAFGVDLLFVWFLLAFLLNYIPTVGSLVAGGLAAGYAFLTKDLGTAAIVGGGILAIEQVIGNYVDPRVQGRQVAISPLVLLIALLLWSWIWGLAGAFLAVPMTITIMIVTANVGPLRPVALLLSDETDEAGLDRIASPDKAGSD
jgi:AI-2 transport protein TqsA